MLLSPATHAAIAAGWVPPPLHQAEFLRIRNALYEWTGIALNDSKKALVASRLEPRLRNLVVNSYRDYVEMAEAPGSDERQVMIDLLTTNETHFFREPRHFEFIGRHVLPRLAHAEVRIWSAACSTGEEVYSLAMTVAHHHPGEWRVLGGDISRRALDVARKAIYPIASAKEIPKEYLARYCLKGVRSQKGTFTIDERIKRGTELLQMNLNGAWPEIEPCHVILVRNVMIYFDSETQHRLIERFRQALKPGGYLIVGHAESMMVSDPRFKCLRPSVYQLGAAP